MAVFGWKAAPEQYPPQELLDYAVVAEEAGFDSIDVSDHFHPWSDDGQACFTWTWLGAVAARTQRIEMGTGLTCPILRYNPAVIAQAAATVAALAPGRFFLGVGTGEALNEYAATGMWPSYEERQERLAEAITLIRELWKGEPVTWRGKFYETRKARLYTLPQTPPPIYVSTMVPQSAAFAGEYGDGLLTVGGQPPEMYQQMLAEFARGARKAGKNPDEMPKLIELTVGYGEDQKAEMDGFMKYWAGSLVPALYDQNIYTPAMSAQNGAVVGPEVVRQKGCFSNDAEVQARFLRQYLEMGFTYLYVHHAGPDEAGFLRRYARDVLAQVRGGQGSQDGTGQAHDAREPALR